MTDDNKMNIPPNILRSDIENIISIDDFFKLRNELQNKKKDKIAIFDTRTPTEFKKATIPGALNLPILSDKERKQVGILYHTKGKEIAIQKGLDVVAPKIKEMIDFVKSNSKSNKSSTSSKNSHKEVFVFCARGGMRSGSVVNILRDAGIDAKKIEGGFKAYRQKVLEFLKKFKLPRLIVLSGLTGTGKTELLNYLMKNKIKNVIDLEGLAKHRSSVLGAVNLSPRSQIAFETYLVDEIIRINKLKADYVFIEGESRKIGNVIIPEQLFSKMKKGIDVYVKCSDKTRVKRIVKEYFSLTSAKEIEKLVSKMDFFTKKFGHDKTKRLISMLKEKKYEEYTLIMLHDYYDKLYRHTLDAKTYKFEIDTDSIKDAAKNLIKFEKNQKNKCKSKKFINH